MPSWLIRLGIRACTDLPASVVTCMHVNCTVPAAKAHGMCCRSKSRHGINLTIHTVPTLQILTGAVPIVILGVLAAACILEHAEWKGDASSMSTSQLWGGDSAEEANHDEAITIAEHIDKGAVNAGTPPPIDPEIMKEVPACRRIPDSLTTACPSDRCLALWLGCRWRKQRQSRRRSLRPRRHLRRCVESDTCGMLARTHILTLLLPQGKTPEPAEASAPAGSSDSGAGDAGAAAAPAANGAGPDAVDAAASAAPVAAAPVVAPHPAPAATAA